MESVGERMSYECI